MSSEIAILIRLFKIKVQSNLSNEAFCEIMKAPKWVDICINSCCVYTNDFSNLNECPFCKKERYQNQFQRDKPRCQFAYFSIIDHIIIQYQDITQAKNLLYLEKGYFKNKHDNALLASIDGFQIFKQKTDDCWILLFINVNLPPEQRVKKENLLISTVIPGPKEPKDLNSFLFPAISELHEFEKGIECSSVNYDNKFILHGCVLSWSGDTPALTKLMGLTEKKGEIYNPANLSLRTHNDISKKSILFDLNTTNFPKTFTVDIMRLFYENIASYMLNYWMGSFFTDPNLNNGEYVLCKETWDKIGKEMHQI
ncbi:19249_t:CDS:2 [Gigaspora rosea]|nr:19249_t:CDS:2 [Gigaspora rosea]